MPTVDIQQLVTDLEQILTRVQREDVAVTRNGEVIAVISRPKPDPGTEDYWKWREQVLASIPPIPEWDSATVISDDRDAR